MGAARGLRPVRQGVGAAASVVAYAAIRVLIRAAALPPVRRIPVHGRAVARPHRLGTVVIVWFVKVYQDSFLRDRLKQDGRTCVYLPTCTDYAQRAVRKYGLLRGLLITGDRFRRCSEGGGGSYVDFP
ncbi:membrane protein insertion efficiency factor YidD [Streptomyces sp. NPDC047974]|uniref:membrane protein insertion efficiency factor YidD n=1 Tax=Streptomyces sp. NPDC047974 TaxID=3154343 RepID=UPI0033FB9527